MPNIIGQEKPSLEVLAHHGVKGMKWGVRKDRAASNDAAPAIAIGAAYAAALLAAATFTAQDSGKFHQMRTKNVEWKKDTSLTHKMTVDQLQNKVVAPINANYGASGTKMNCRRCTLAYEMRRRGYDVKATNSRMATGQDASGLHSATSNKLKSESIWGSNQISTPHQLAIDNPGKKASDIFAALGKEPNGARGELGVGWRMGGGHSMAWEIVNGKPVIFDTQNSKTYLNEHLFTQFAGSIGDAAYTRLDNATLNDAFLRKWAQNV